MEQIVNVINIKIQPFNLILINDAINSINIPTTVVSRGKNKDVGR